MLGEGYCGLLHTDLSLGNCMYAPLCLCEGMLMSLVSAGCCITWTLVGESYGGAVFSENNFIFFKLCKRERFFTLSQGNKKKIWHPLSTLQWRAFLLFMYLFWPLKEAKYMTKQYKWLLGSRNGTTDEI